MAQTTSADVIQRPFIQRLVVSLQRRSQILLDKSTPHSALRWVGFVCLTLLYLLRVWYLQGFYIVTYGLGIYLLNLFIGFLQPQDDMDDKNGQRLPSFAGEDEGEFRPFARRVPEFKFWWSATKAVLISMTMTLFSVFDIPVFWPILLLYFIVLFTITMKRQIEHMIKHSYIPCDCFRKKKYGRGGKDAHKVVKKKKVVPVMPKVRAPIRGLPTSGIKKVNRD
mmetsp:Transcript_59999/g.95291  ORF Transcript_59999/g.95291 Transcript_59999/m.95291 type:complete len:223 (+) Transcript_59999:56-724(+)|eukprot:CAMPEP_0197025378 /NCGR_PEP_ID=MMETSP1384-20130603/5740_1 /TAXON_ID=29189 /ORGANISM="Ammonia sp." /LENGTH=222 /DNA_ID=CAMNT_0042453905 /DNA_START=51 /DNA_END=719 /DNA_ORIENTATION=+